MAILSLIGWAGLARVIRGMVLSIRRADFVAAAEALGRRIDQSASTDKRGRRPRQTGFKDVRHTPEEAAAAIAQQNSLLRAYAELEGAVVALG